VKIVVVSKKGKKEILTLAGNLTIIEGENMSRIVNDSGVEHWFNTDGTYDGWGMALSQGVSVDVAESITKVVEAQRKKLEVKP
jgi:hypothetical protein